VTASSSAEVETLRSRLHPWLSSRGGFAALSEFEAPATGASNGTYLFEARRTDGSTEQLVLRLQPKENQFLDPDVMFQAAVMEMLAAHPSVPVPSVLWKEPSPDVLGAPFAIMDRIPGRVLSDTHHDSGWATELPADARRRLYDSAIEHLALLHRVPVTDEMGFVRRPGDGTPLDRHMEWLQRWHAWAARGRALEVIDDGLAYVLRECPADPSEVIVWGDARPGNMVFGDGLEVAALLDWELAATGPRGIDLGWWLMFEESQTSARGIPPLSGVPDEQETVARYEQVAGVAVADLGFYKTLAALQFAIIVLRFVDLQVAAGLMPASTTMGTRTPVTGMLAASIGLDPPPLSPDYEVVLAARRDLE
jgi:aminoglycoside phosphotransferase (APT) family kinase protein